MCLSVVHPKDVGRGEHEAMRVKAQTRLVLKRCKHRIDTLFSRSTGMLRMSLLRDGVAEGFNHIRGITSSPDDLKKCWARMKKTTNLFRYKQKLDDIYFYFELLRAGRRELAVK